MEKRFYRAFRRMMSEKRFYRAFRRMMSEGASIKTPAFPTYGFCFASGRVAGAGVMAWLDI